MSLSSKISLRPLRNSVVFCVVRTTAYARPLPPAAAKQLPAPSESGFFSYTRNWSRDKKYDLSLAPQRGDTPRRFLTRRLGHAYELYPLIFLGSFCAGIVVFTCWYSFNKAEIFLDKSTREPPGSWERVHDKYWKQPTLLFDATGTSHQRLEIMEVLEDEMLDAAKKRGTRE